MATSKSETKTSGAQKGNKNAKKAAGGDLRSPRRPSKTNPLTREQRKSELSAIVLDKNVPDYIRINAIRELNRLDELEVNESAAIADAKSMVKDIQDALHKHSA